MAQQNLEQMIEILSGMEPDDMKIIDSLIAKDKQDLVWVPNPGPQTEAYDSLADEVFYGGQAGGGKTDLGLGLALTRHKRSLLLRRTNKEANGLVDRMQEMLGTRDGWGSQSGVWRRPNNVIIGIGGCQVETDKQKYKGIPRDFYFFDEVSDFEESQYTFITAWNRTTEKGQRCRILAAGNPPTRPEGLWVIKRWGAWLDPQHPNPAKPGELRWYTTGADGEEIEVDGRGPHWIQGRQVFARSRTYIPAQLSDNPDLTETSDYQAALDALPPELRDAYRDGDFTTALRDDPMQLIPTDWVAQAQRRWQPTAPVGVPMCAMGADVAIRKDKYVLAPRYDGWYAKLIILTAAEVKDPLKAAGRVVAERRDNAVVIVDVGGGYGAECYGQLQRNDITSVAYMGVTPSTKWSADGLFQFSNVRTEAWWRFREALDPTQPGGSRVALPPSVTLKADLCAPSYEVKGKTPGGVLIAESKKDVCKRLGRSTDEGDAVVMGWYDGLVQETIKGGWKGYHEQKQVKVNLGRTGSVRRRR